MIRHRFLMLTAVLVGIAMGGLATPARADFEVQLEYAGNILTVNNTKKTYTDNYGKVYTTSDGTGGAAINFNWDGFDYAAGTVSLNGIVISANGKTPGFTVSSTMSESNSPGSNDLATINTSSLSIKNQTGVAGYSSLTITTGDTGFMSPHENTVSVLSSVGATAYGGNSASASVTFNSYIDTTNTQFGKQQGGLGIALVSIAPGGTQSGNFSEFLDASTIPYSVTNVVKYTLSNGDKFTDGSLATTVTAPAPAGFFLAVSGLPVIGLVFLRRRNLRAAA